MNTKSPEDMNARVAHLEQALGMEMERSRIYGQTTAALHADRNKLEAEVRRLTDEAGRKPEVTGDTLTSVVWPRSCLTPEQITDMANAGEIMGSKYWQEKYHEAKRLYSMEAKVAADQVASLQYKLEHANVQTGHWRECSGKLESQLKCVCADVVDLKAQLEGARARAVQENEESLLRSGPDVRKDYSTTEEFRRSILNLGAEILEINRGNGWDVTKPSDWPKYPDDDVPSGTAKVRKLMTNLALIHSEVSEASEAVRKLDRQNFEEELADVIIRVLDTSHGLGIDLGPVICEKLKKNRGRGHKHGGKAI